MDGAEEVQATPLRGLRPTRCIFYTENPAARSATVWSSPRGIGYQQIPAAVPPNREFLPTRTGPTRAKTQEARSGPATNVGWLIGEDVWEFEPKLANSSCSSRRGSDRVSGSRTARSAIKPLPDFEESVTTA